jgi:hypothetical protein
MYATSVAKQLEHTSRSGHIDGEREMARVWEETGRGREEFER